jgi:hypothetical protein
VASYFFFDVPSLFSSQNNDSLLEQAMLKKLSSDTLGSATVTELHHICRVPKDQTAGYVCQGPEYEAFADNLEAFVNEESKCRPTTWGKRIIPFPSNSTILAVGNSLTRQMFSFLPCQYPDQVASWVDEEGYSTNPMRRGTFYRGVFKNGATLYLVTNHAMFYSPRWPEFLARLIQVDSFNDQIDALVVGHINHFMNAYNTSFMEIMKEQTKKWDGADFESVPPPTWIDFAQLYYGPMVGVSMMADWSSTDQDYIEFTSQAHKMNRSNVRVVHGRKYISELGECGTNVWWDIGRCEEKRDVHRCIGARGGHPDLISWDALEAVNELLLVSK